MRLGYQTPLFFKHGNVHRSLRPSNLVASIILPQRVSLTALPLRRLSLPLANSHIGKTLAADWHTRVRGGQEKS